MKNFTDCLFSKWWILQYTFLTSIEIIVSPFDLLMSLVHFKYWTIILFLKYKALTHVLLFFKYSYEFKLLLFLTFLFPVVLVPALVYLSAKNNIHLLSDFILIIFWFMFNFLVFHLHFGTSILGLSLLWY